MLQKEQRHKKKEKKLQKCSFNYSSTNEITLYGPFFVTKVVSPKELLPLSEKFNTFQYFSLNVKNICLYF